MTDDRWRPIVLIGFMGCGKSTVGRALADRLRWDFVDTDTLIEEREAMAVPAIFAESGEDHFRRVERQAMRDSARPSTVVAAGGGAFLGHATRVLMQGVGRTVWLDVPLATLRNRLSRGTSRPLWDATDPLAQRILHDRRRAAYALAEVWIHAADLTVEAVVERILSEIP